MTASGYQMKRLKVDSTLHLPSFCGVPNLRGSVVKEGALAIDTCGGLLYMWTRTGGWDTINVSGGGGGGSTDTTSLSNRINLKLNISDTASMLSPYLRAIDTSNKWVNSITRTSGKDSIIYFIGGNRFAIKDSVGSAGGGTVAVDTIFRTLGKDSIFYKKNGITYAIKDSVGNAGAGGGGGGGGKIYYFNGGVNLGTFGGITMYELGDTAITGTAANFTRATTGNIANFITDVNKPGLLQIPAGVWTIDAFLSETGGGSNHAQIYAKLEKWNGSTITDIATSPVEEITNGNVIDLYTYAISVPTTTLSATDRIIIQFYIQNTNGKTVTLYTQNGYVGEVHTTFTTGIGALNGLTTPSQTFAVGTSGTDFGISSASSTHTFNLPTASSTNRGALSTTDWSTFNGKLSASDTVSLSNRINGKLTIADTSALQRKSIPAYSFLANNTNATANATAQYFKDTSGTYSGTITWNGTAPTSGTFSYRWTRIGKMVNLNIALVYANAGSTNTQVVVTLPADAPTPTKPAGLTSALNMLYPVSANVNITNQSTLTSATIRAMMRSNTANNGFEFLINTASQASLNAFITCTYFTD
jgi:hypothetical protein